jgi:hypothetical protein
MKDLTMDLWTLPIVSPAGKTTHLNDEAEQDPFVTLHEFFFETTSKASFSNTLMLAVPVCASAQACASRGKAMKSLKKKPPLNQVGFFTHTIRTKANSIKFARQSLCSPRISTHSQRGDKVPEPKPSHGKGPHEEAPSRNLQHYAATTANAPVRTTTSKYTSCIHQQ